MRRLTENVAPRADPTDTTSTDTPLLPDYGGACISSVAEALSARNGDAPADWLPGPAVGARQVVLLVLDGLGWEQLREARSTAPTLSSGEGGAITSVVPTTTATALTSITTGLVPAQHGVVGYRLRFDDDVLNVLKWRSAGRDMRRLLPAARFQPATPFGGARPPAVTRSEFASTGFTALHLGGTRLVGWGVPSSLVVHVRSLLEGGEEFVYAYYDGLDKVAHAHGLGAFYEAELRCVDRLIGDLIEVLPPGAVLVMTSDHGQVEVGPAVRMIDAEVFELIELVSGEGRFRWLHARNGAEKDLIQAAVEAHGSEAWARTKEEIVEGGWFGGPLDSEVSRRLGDVALVAREPVAFLDPADTGETRLAARHGSLTSSEMYVPLLAWRAP